MKLPDPISDEMGILAIPREQPKDLRQIKR